MMLRPFFSFYFIIRPPAYVSSANTKSSIRFLQIVLLDVFLIDVSLLEDFLLDDLLLDVFLFDNFWFDDFLLGIPSLPFFWKILVRLFAQRVFGRLVPE